MAGKKSKRVFGILKEVKRLACEYYKLTDKPLGVTGEVAEFEAAEKLGLVLCEARAEGCDATKWGYKFQIEGRKLKEGSKDGKTGRFSKSNKWNFALLVLLDANFSATQIYLARKKDINAALNKKGSKARTERRQLTVSRFKSLAGKKPVWSSLKQDQNSLATFTKAQLKKLK